MSVGTYGINKLSRINVETDVSIFYHFRPNRNSTDASFGDNFQELSPTQILKETNFTNTRTAGGTVLSGMYTLNLPLTVFNQKGIYTLLITPKEIYTTIFDSPANLSAFQDVRGVVIKTNGIDGGTSTTCDNSNLVGWRIDYFNEDGNKSNMYRIVTSNNYVEPIAAATSTSLGKSVSYRFNDSSNLSFLTVSPSTAPSIKSSATPYIGTTGETIALVNTFFNPQVIEIEMVESDIDSLMAVQIGDQALNLDKGIITYYNNNHQIVAQNEIMQLKDSYTGSPVYTFRVGRTNNIDKSESFDNTIATINRQ
jgi:hypothetical protein